MNPFENYTPPAVEDILSDDPNFTVKVLALKQLRIAAENCEALLRDGTLEDVLAGKEAYEYTRPVGDLQRFGNFESPQQLMAFMKTSTLLGMAEAMGRRKVPKPKGRPDVEDIYNDASEPHTGTIQIRINK